MKSTARSTKKLDLALTGEIVGLKKPNILEFGVQVGSSTSKFIEICKKNKGKLFSIDVDDYSKLFEEKLWKFIKSRDDNFKYIFKRIPAKIDLIYLDTIHTAKHVEKIIYNYFDLLNEGGYFFIDDISHLPYLKSKDSNSFYCEINNKETFDLILDIYNNNLENIEIKFSFEGTGTCIIKKISNKKLNKKNKINTREKSLKNILRKFIKKV
jgi:predicted O-methyltransferase YrrM